MHHVEIDLGKLNPFISDPVVRRIECNGPGQNIVVMVPMPKYTNIILNKEEIDEIIKIFEKKSKIPASEGIYNIILGKLVFSAIISDVIGSKFSIKKINYAPIY
jgi:type IV secretory pathway ATPase VirB11/archaellum biosynthesis ATPase